MINVFYTGLISYNQLDGVDLERDNGSKRHASEYLEGQNGSHEGQHGTCEGQHGTAPC